jgi:hypothetical protein
MRFYEVPDVDGIPQDHQTVPLSGYRLISTITEAWNTLVETHPTMPEEGDND